MHVTKSLQSVEQRIEEQGHYDVDDLQGWLQHVEEEVNLYPQGVEGGEGRLYVGVGCRCTPPGQRQQNITMMSMRRSTIFSNILLPLCPSSPWRDPPHKSLYMMLLCCKLDHSTIYIFSSVQLIKVLHNVLHRDERRANAFRSDLCAVHKSREKVGGEATLAKNCRTMPKVKKVFRFCHRSLRRPRGRLQLWRMLQKQWRGSTWTIIETLFEIETSVRTCEPLSPLIIANCWDNPKDWSNERGESLTWIISSPRVQFTFRRVSLIEYNHLYITVFTLDDAVRILTRQKRLFLSIILITVLLVVTPSQGRVTLVHTYLRSKAHSLIGTSNLPNKSLWRWR